jgi:hypothetical protein
MTDGIKGYTADRAGNIYGPGGNKLKSTPVKGGTSDAGGATVGHHKVHIGDKWPYVHRLVAAAFGLKTEGKEIRHSDDNPENNSVKNLSPGSRQENIDDRKKKKTRKQLREEMAEKIAGGK